MSNENIRHAIVSTDILIFSYKDGELFAILVEVKNPEYLGQLAFPGALIMPSETAKQSVLRVIESKLGLQQKKIYTEELGAYSEIDRDVRGRVVSIAFIGLSNFEDLQNLENAKFKTTNVRQIKKLAYDHIQILKDAKVRLQEKFSNSTIAQKLLGKDFTMTELYNLYCTVLEKEIDKRNFAKKIKSLNIIVESGGVIKGMKHRPAKLFEFKDKKVHNLEIF